MGGCAEEVWTDVKADATVDWGIPSGSVGTKELIKDHKADPPEITVFVDSIRGSRPGCGKCV